MQSKKDLFSKIAKISYFKTNDNAVKMIEQEWENIELTFKTIMNKHSEEDPYFRLVTTSVNFDDIREDNVDNSENLTHDQLKNNAYDWESGYFVLPKGDSDEE
ncbi:hypothetical protein EI74_0270 [Mycoplasma testudineum]|uniref:Aspartyl/glutamyl-tRNA(Asn/Gln) amidotransferase subunit C n=1 Tax=Mycoplasma testudineum TaxID=244584 RepID=A0A4R6IDU6_9MOLU|nr:hypothetical protein [Mycoplasma testudineum]OYD26895.1 hypothetical protein CG473_00965 [Mycoplasma testudineum]TDO20443.1 hypothetical protein EI74_0270 [Mycoplasma testudineum]